MRSLKPSAVFLLFVFVAPPIFHAQQTSFDDVKIRFTPTNQHLAVDKNALLVFDDGARRLVVKSGDRPLDVSYEDIHKIVLETDHRGVDPAKFMITVGGAWAPEKRKTLWFYLEYKQTDRPPESYLIRIGEKIKQQFVEKAKAVFGGKVVFPEFPEQPEALDKEQLPEREMKFSAKQDKKNHPLPDINPDKALVVVVCPAINTRYVGRNPLKIHANNRVVGINTMGTYTFFDLEPGEYLLVSQAGDASGVRIRVEPGKDYYFLQTSIVGWVSAKSILSRQSKELVMYEVNGAHYSDWKRK